MPPDDMAEAAETLIRLRGAQKIYLGILKIVNKIF